MTPISSIIPSRTSLTTLPVASVVTPPHSPTGVPYTQLFLCFNQAAPRISLKILINASCSATNTSLLADSGVAVGVAVSVAVAVGVTVGVAVGVAVGVTGSLSSDSVFVDWDL